jgi:hypothetical protein
MIAMTAITSSVAAFLLLSGFLATRALRAKASPLLRRAR